MVAITWLQAKTHSGLVYRYQIVGKFAGYSIHVSSNIPKVYQARKYREAVEHFEQTILKTWPKLTAK